MRIGNLDDMGSSENSENLAKLIQSDPAENLTKPEKWKNWWHYHKWYVIWGVVALVISCDLIGNALGIGEKKPDYQIAYIGSMQLPQDMAASLEEAFARLTLEDGSTVFATDFNEDGDVVVRINQYIYGGAGNEMESAYSGYAAEVNLIGDISDCESYFFLMDNPDDFQREYQLLALPDGNCPDESDYAADDKVILWSDCPALSEVAAIAEEKAPGSKELLSGLYIGRRCFYTDKITENYEKCSKLWDLLAENY